MPSGEEQWLAEVLKDEEQTHKVVKKYREHRTMYGGTGPKQRFLLLEVK